MNPLPDIADAVVVIAEATATHPPGTPLDPDGNPVGNPLPHPED